MSAARDVDWARLKALFAAALEVAPERRDDWLAAQCGDAAALLAELRALLAERDAEPHSLLREDAAPLLDAAIAAAAAGESRPPGSTIGPYRLLSLLGSGGMGSVHVAERADGQFRQRVALKVIRGEYRSPELRARFLRERDILARLAHPNIAALHDGGVDADGTPYFTLELIDGMPVTHWCDAHASSVRERVTLLLQVCDAVEYAHHNLVVHRDLKPSNILVTSQGAPKLLDFGIAKLLDEDASPGLTGANAQPMTREYAAPEQVLGEPVTTATDVHALGVLLYELSSGHLPFARAESGEASWPKAIVEEIPEPLTRAADRPAVVAGAAPVSRDLIARRRGLAPAALRRALRGDLSRIAARALEKSPQSRYASAAALAEDLRAWRDGRALPGGSRRYRAGKFLRRHRVALSVAALFAAVVCVAVGALVSEARRTAEQAQAALREARTTAAVKDFLLELFRKADPNVAKGRDLSARELLDRGAERVAAIPADQGELKAELQNALGTIYFQLGLNKQAAALHEQALAALQSSGDQGQIARAERDLATELVPLGDYARARQLAEASVARMQALPDAPAADRVGSFYTLGWVAAAAHRADAAKQAAETAIAIARTNAVDEHLLALALNLRGTVAYMLHDNEAAQSSFGEALAIDERTLGPDDQLTLRDVNGVAAALRSMGRYAEAVSGFRRSLDGYGRLYGPDDVRTLHAREGVALIEQDAGLYSDARRDFESILAALKANPPQNNRFEMEVAGNYAMLLAEFGELAAAETLEASALDAFARLLGPQSAFAGEANANLAWIHALQGRLEVAEDGLRAAIAAKRERHDDDLATELTRLSEVRRQRSDAAEATALAREALDSAQRGYGAHSIQAARARAARGLALLATPDKDAGIAELRAAVVAFDAATGASGRLHPASADVRLALGKALAASPASRADEARLLLQQAAELRNATFGAEHPFVREARAAGDAVPGR